MSGEYESEVAYAKLHDSLDDGQATFDDDNRTIDDYYNSLDDDQASYDDRSPYDDLGDAGSGDNLWTNYYGYAEDDRMLVDVSSEGVKRFKAELHDRVPHIGRGLYELFSVQGYVSAIRDTGTVRAIDDSGEPPNPETVAMYAFSLVKEVGELAQELGYKAWQPSPPVFDDERKVRVADEFADVLAFVGVLLHIANRRGVSTGAIAFAYEKKSMVNVDRQLGTAEGYGLPSKDKEPTVARPVSTDDGLGTTKAWRDLEYVLEMGERSDGPFTDLTVSTHPELMARVQGAMTLYSGPSRFVKGMRKIVEGGGNISPRQVRAVANILYRESINEDY